MCSTEVLSQSIFIVSLHLSSRAVETCVLFLIPRVSSQVNTGLEYIIAPLWRCDTLLLRAFWHSKGRGTRNEQYAVGRQETELTHIFLQYYLFPPVAYWHTDCMDQAISRKVQRSSFSKRHLSLAPHSKLASTILPDATVLIPIILRPSV